MNAFEWLLLVFLYTMLEKHLWNSSSLHLLVEILQLVHEISSFSVVLYKRGVLKNFSKFTDKLKKQSLGSALSKDVLRNFAKFTGKHLCQSLYFNKVAGQVCNFIKIETLAQVFSCEFWEISKNTFFTEYAWAAAFLVFEKVTQLVARALMVIRRKKKLVKVKPLHWHFCII